MKWIFKDDLVPTTDSLIEDLLNHLLKNRGIGENEKLDFLEKKDYDDPFLFADMSKVVKRILQARDNKEKIVIHGDYDVDGVTASSILFLYFTKALGIENVSVYIPNRYEEGYGLSLSTIDGFIKDKVNLLITVDCGIKDELSIVHAQKSDIDVIITDHHTFEKLPSAFAVIHPYKYPTQLCGAGVAFKIIQALDKHLGLDYSENLVDLAGLGTICDVMEVKGENRVIIKRAIEKLRKNKRLGLQNLFLTAGLDKNVIDTYHVGFVIGPRLNASGRLKSAYDSLYLLTTDDKDKAREYADSLNNFNVLRQEETKRALDIALTLIDKSKYINITYIPDISIGVVGLIASRLTEMTQRPSIVLTDDKLNKIPGVLTGSCRSIDDVNITGILTRYSDLFLSFGGHKKAAGLKLNKSNLEEFKIKVEEEMEGLLKGKEFEKIIHIDFSIDVNIYDLKSVYNVVGKLEPFGEGNPRPIFHVKGVKIKNPIYLGENGKHLKLILENNVEAIGFNMGNRKAVVNDIIDIVFSVNKNVWQNIEKFQMNMIDFKLQRDSD